MHDFLVSLQLQDEIGTEWRVDEKWREINSILRTIDRGSM